MSVQATDDSYEGICPVCGDWTTLEAATGFCVSCTLAHVEPGGDYKLCNICNVNPVKGSSRCWTCKHTIFLERHADSIEELMQEGFSFTKSIKLIRGHNRPICLSCGDLIYGGHVGRNFCTKRDICKRAARRYRTLKDMFIRQNYLYPAEAALNQVKREIADRKA